VLQIANKLAGYSLGEADLLRRAMGKKSPAEMAKHAEKFVAGATQNGIDAKKAEEIFGLMAEFAGYGFPKAHSTAYALITYQTAYLKANHAREYLAALLTVESGNHDKLTRYIAHAREKGIEILPPDVNESCGATVVAGDPLRSRRREERGEAYRGHREVRENSASPLLSTLLAYDRSV
jgi:DNA polymerase-3 subunit alpha